MDDSTYMNAKTDEELIAEQKFDELISRHADWIVKVAHRKGCGDNSEDIASEVVIEILTGKRCYDPNIEGKKSGKTSSFRTWLYLMVIRPTITKWRRKSNNISKNFISLNDNQEDQPIREVPHFDTPEKNLLQQELIERFPGIVSQLAQCLEAIEQKNPQAAQAIRYIYIEEMEFQEIAVLLNLKNKTTAQSWCYRGKDYLRKCLGSKGVTEECLTLIGLE